MTDLRSTLPVILGWLPFRKEIKSALVSSLRLGPLPKHVALIMDGNRRFSRRLGAKPIKGHEAGFEALKSLLDFFLHLDITTVTVYAFSIDNFRRTEEEVEGLMDLARNKLGELCQKGELLQRYGIRVRVIGRRDLLPIEVQRACLSAERLTAHNTRGCLNICFPYTSRDEMTQSLRSAISDVGDHLIEPSDITPELLDDRLYTAQTQMAYLEEPSEPDILIRTSGVSRLSDFLLWQISDQTSLHFLPRCWPDIGVADVLPVLLGWQAERIRANFISALHW
ncbi:uncharacterized protein L969DRAFT_16987 [Mixia osmundae IAM 14324]|uniref:Alkyl transferase n=1 Tax=Mixia osmundae (strain CBS 9802 / IAM 14324 / JCM 22182 / KY 12970) TaxID=764103 RepID=G7DVE3_MIXOS|nr:uncharacterized protein L969DRAFT_16987 [Mixia osmundae IAM 14324]KEI40331.1 hypothetical protein L969DRAFT_16987 [Mixia osmundae IAM 14324]GAA94553.1 hypothetical protein E5Q_01205 [Mixia osmundae IAM 14324]